MIYIYSTPHCSACAQAKQLCTQAGVEFQAVDLMSLDSTAMADLTAKYGIIRKAPLLVQNGEVLKDLNELREYINEIK